MKKVNKERFVKQKDKKNKIHFYFLLLIMINDGLIIDSI